MISAPTIPPVDWRPIQGSLGSFRAGYEEIEQFVAQLLDEIDAAWQQLESERARPVTQTRSVSEDGAAHGAALHDGGESRGLVLLEPQDLADGSESMHFADAVARRISESEQERFALQAEVEFLRGQLAEQTEQITAERRQAVEERAVWAGELRQLREAIHRQMEAFGAMSPAAGPPARNGPGGRQALAASDPVLGPLVTQIKTLHRDAEARRQAPATEAVGTLRLPSAAGGAQRFAGR